MVGIILRNAYAMALLYRGHMASTTVLVNTNGQSLWCFTKIWEIQVVKWTSQNHFLLISCLKRKAIMSRSHLKVPWRGGFWKSQLRVLPQNTLAGAAHTCTLPQTHNPSLRRLWKWIESWIRKASQCLKETYYRRGKPPQTKNFMHIYF